MQNKLTNSLATFVSNHSWFSFFTKFYCLLVERRAVSICMPRRDGGGGRYTGILILNSVSRSDHPTPEERSLRCTLNESKRLSGCFEENKISCCCRDSRPRPSVQSLALSLHQLRYPGLLCVLYMLQTCIKPLQPYLSTYKVCLINKRTTHIVGLCLM